MVLEKIQRITVDEFDKFVNLPENQEQHFEFIGGEIVEVPSNPLSSHIATIFIVAIGIYLKQHDIGWLTGADGGYQVAGERYAPDVAFISKAKQAELPYDIGYNPNPPDLVVEVVSPTDNLKQLLVKVQNYLSEGTTVWVAYPVEREVSVHRQNQPVQVLTINDTLDGGDLLPGFKLPLKDIFPSNKADTESEEES